MELKEDRLAMNDTARRADHRRKFGVQLGPVFVMSQEHSTCLVEAEHEFYQGLCLCGWYTMVTFKEEADLLRAIHAHEVAVFGGGS